MVCHQLTLETHAQLDIFPHCSHFIQEFQFTCDPNEAAMRFMGNKTISHKGLVSPGPNEEWCIDGHEKLKEQMGIEVWGICDKYSPL
ncbi:hypothetical protein JB92DRAFT_2693102 [Gautieria morchelliformis]|nr:hypothetical protein JB92DRAFT_2693102 [Gautieria morchelliformis]